MNTMELQQGLDSNPKWVERAIVVLYERQTADEQRSSTTKVSNGMGFAACDARVGTYMAKWILSGKHLDGTWLDRARRMAKKYIRQLLEAAAKKEAQQSLRNIITSLGSEKIDYKLVPPEIRPHPTTGKEVVLVVSPKPEDFTGIPTK
jgi:hypothetical protein